MSPAAAEVRAGEMNDAPARRWFRTTSPEPVPHYQCAGAVNYRVKAYLRIEQPLEFIQLEHSVKGERNVIQVNAVIQRYVATDIDVDYWRVGPALLKEVVQIHRQASEYLLNFIRIIFPAFGAVAMN